MRELAVARPVSAIASLTRGAEMRERALHVASAAMPDEAMDTILTTEGQRSPSYP